MNNVVIPRAKPQLVRKRTQIAIPQTTKVVINNKDKSVAIVDNKVAAKPRQLIRHRKPPAPQPESNQVRIPSAVSKNTILNKRARSNKKVKVKYITRDAPPEAIIKAQRLRTFGVDKVLIIMGNGPSINEVQLERLNGHDKIHTMSINKPDPRLWPTTHWAFFDASQFRRHKELWDYYTGKIFNSTAIKQQKDGTVQIKNIGGHGFSKDMSQGIHIGRSSVYAAMQIGISMNYNKIYIFGCDMNEKGLNGQMHFYGTNPDVKPEERRRRFTKEAEYYNEAARLLSEDDRQRFMFCSRDINPWAFMDHFPTIHHTDAIDTILQYVQQQ